MCATSLPASADGTTAGAAPTRYRCARRGAGMTTSLRTAVLAAMVVSPHALRVPTPARVPHAPRAATAPRTAVRVHSSRENGKDGWRRPDLSEMWPAAGEGMANWRSARAHMTMHGVPVAGEENLGASASQIRRICQGNSALLRQQNPELSQEFAEDVWAHELPFPEAGTLLLRTPFDDQLINSPGPWKDHIFDAVVAEAEALPLSVDQINQRVANHLDDPIHMMKVVEMLVEEQMEQILKKVQDGETVNPLQADLLANYEEHTTAWQEVLMVMEDNQVDGTKALVINRPVGQGVSPNLAVMLYERYVGTWESPRNEMADLNAFVDSFEDGPVYDGGPEGKETYPSLLHGYPLPGAREVGRGTRIYEGGYNAAAEAVRLGSRRALDFRICLGQRYWAPGKLEDEIKHGLWIPVACSRAVAIKQALQLPKPLWHEIMELMGGDYAEVSRLELQRRGLVDEA